MKIGDEVWIATDPEGYVLGTAEGPILDGERSMVRRQIKTWHPSGETKWRTRKVRLVAVANTQPTEMEKQLSDFRLKAIERSTT